MKNRKWKELSSKVVLETPFFRLFKKDFRRPDGLIVKDYYLMEKPESVHVVAVNSDGKVVLIRHYRPGPDGVTLELPAGYVKKGETLEAACQRELLEETGYKANHFLEISNFTENTSRFVGYPCHLFIARDLIKVTEKLILDTGEIEVVMVSLDDAIQMIEKGEIKDLMCSAGLLLAQRFLQ